MGESLCIGRARRWEQGGRESGMRLPASIEEHEVRSNRLSGIPGNGRVSHAGMGESLRIGRARLIETRRKREYENWNGIRCP